MFRPLTFTHLQLDHFDISFSASFRLFATQNTPRKTSPGDDLQSLIALSCSGLVDLHMFRSPLSLQHRLFYLLSNCPITRLFQLQINTVNIIAFKYYDILVHKAANTVTVMTMINIMITIWKLNMLHVDITKFTHPRSAF